MPDTVLAHKPNATSATNAPDLLIRLVMSRSSAKALLYHCAMPRGDERLTPLVAPACLTDIKRTRTLCLPPLSFLAATGNSRHHPTPEPRARDASKYLPSCDGLLPTHHAPESG